MSCALIDVGLRSSRFNNVQNDPEGLFPQLDLVDVCNSMPDDDTRFRTFCTTNTPNSNMLSACSEWNDSNPPGSVYNNMLDANIASPDILPVLWESTSFDEKTNGDPTIPTLTPYVPLPDMIQNPVMISLTGNKLLVKLSSNDMTQYATRVFTDLTTWKWTVLGGVNLNAFVPKFTVFTQSLIAFVGPDGGDFNVLLYISVQDTIIQLPVPWEPFQPGFGLGVQKINGLAISLDNGSDTASMYIVYRTLNPGGSTIIRLIKLNVSLTTGVYTFDTGVTIPSTGESAQNRLTSVLETSFPDPVVGNLYYSGTQSVSQYDLVTLSGGINQITYNNTYEPSSIIGRRTIGGEDRIVLSVYNIAAQEFGIVIVNSSSFPSHNPTPVFTAGLNSMACASLDGEIISTHFRSGATNAILSSSDGGNTFIIIGNPGQDIPFDLSSNADGSIMVISPIEPAVNVVTYNGTLPGFTREAVLGINGIISPDQFALPETAWPWWSTSKKYTVSDLPDILPFIVRSPHQVHEYTLDIGTNIFFPTISAARVNSIHYLLHSNGYQVKFHEDSNIEVTNIVGNVTVFDNLFTDSISTQSNAIPARTLQILNTVPSTQYYVTNQAMYMCIWDGITVKVVANQYNMEAFTNWTNPLSNAYTAALGAMVNFCSRSSNIVGDVTSIDDPSCSCIAGDISDELFAISFDTQTMTQSQVNELLVRFPCINLQCTRSRNNNRLTIGNVYADTICNDSITYTACSSTITVEGETIVGGNLSVDQQCGQSTLGGCTTDVDCDIGTTCLPQNRSCKLLCTTSSDCSGTPGTTCYEPTLQCLTKDEVQLIENPEGLTETTGLSIAEVVGIVIGTVALVIMIALLVLYFKIVKPKNNHRHRIK